MKFDVKETGAWKRELHVQLTEEEVRGEMREVVREFRRKASVPGFRKGKVPDEILEKRFGDFLEEELLNRIIPKAYKKALEESHLDPLGPGDIRDFSYKRGEPLSFVADLEIRPALELRDYEGIKAVKRVFDVAEEEIGRTLEAIRDQNVEHVPVTRPAEGNDRVKVRIIDSAPPGDGETGKESSTKEAAGGSGEVTAVDLGSEGLYPEFREALTGAAVDTVKQVTMHYSEDLSNEDLRGKTKSFQLEVLEIAEKKIPAIDDNLAKSLGFEGLEDLRGRIRIRLEGEELLRAEREVEETLLRQIAERNPFEPPETMVRNLLDNLAEDFEVPEDRRDAFRTEQREGAVRAVRRLLILDTIAKQHGITVGDDEVEAALREGIAEEREAVNAVQEAKKDGRFQRFRHQMRERKILDFLVDRAQIEEVRAVRPGVPQPAPAE